jgi:23S rRNA (adenine2503-C2)-methyltransferase
MDYVVAVSAEAEFTGLTLAELGELLGSRTRALAARRWLYGTRGLPETLPERIPDVAPEAWQRLRERAPLPAWRLRTRERSQDGTIKLALDLGGAAMETVLIPANGRSTVCVSSQAGCTRHCTFCATATLGFGRQLTAGEIVLQYALARGEAPTDAPARNVVFMGMGEPLDNLDEVLAAVERLLENPLPALGAVHVTVSTAGVVPGLKRFLRESRANLALSLNATTDEQRERLMPHNQTWPIAALLECLRDDARWGSGRRYFIEYVLFDGLNDSDDDARRLASLLSGLPAHVNLIPHNPFEGNAWRTPSHERMEAFQRLVHSLGVRCLIRWPRGQDIAAACGQLALRSTVA